MKKSLYSVLVALLIAQSLLFTGSAYAIDEELFLSDIEAESYTIIDGYSYGRDKNIFGADLIIAGVQYEKGVSTHPVAPNVPSEIVYDISGYSSQMNRFSMIAGKDASTDLGTEANQGYKCIIYVKVDGTEVKRSGELIYGDTFEVDINISGAEKITLGVIDCGVFAHLTIDYCNTRLYHSQDKNTENPATSEDDMILPVISVIALSSFLFLQKQRGTT